MLKSIPIYPAYIQDQTGAIWGIPSTLQGELQKEIIHLETTEGDAVSSSDVYFWADGDTIHITHERTLTDGTSSTDYYIQVGGEMAMDASETDCPAEKRATLDSPQWLIETVVINGVQRSDIYNRAMPGATTKGLGPITAAMVSGYVVLDNGLLYMTHDGAYFWPLNRGGANQISEPGYLYRLE